MSLICKLVNHALESSVEVFDISEKSQKASRRR